MKYSFDAALLRSLTLSTVPFALVLCACSTEPSQFEDEDSYAASEQDEQDAPELDVELFVAEREAEGTEPGLVEIAAFAADVGISMDEAAKRLDWQNRSGWLLDIAPQELGAAYGGVWIDVNDGNRVKVAVAPSAVERAGFVANTAQGRSEAMRAKAVSLIEWVGVEDGADVVEVRHSLAQLHEANRWIASELVDLASPQISGGLRTDLNAVEISILKGAGLDEDETAFLDEATERYGQLIEFGEFEETMNVDACVGDYCDTPLRAGVRINNSGRGCTGAFVAKSRVNNEFYQFTAGHCVEDGFGDTWSTRFSNNSLHNIGSVHNSNFGGSQGDIAIMRVNNAPGWFGGSKNRVFVRAQAGETVRNETYRISGTTTSKIGDRVCLSGVTTGTDCGTVQALGQTVTYSGGTTVANMARASYCRAGGDSGGPIYASGKAFGIHSGGSGCTGYYTGIRGAEDSMNVDVVITN